MANLIHVTKTNGDAILIGVRAIKMVEHHEFTPEVSKPVAVDPKVPHSEHKSVPVAAPGPVIGSKITLMDGKDIIVKEPVHKLSDMQ
jgi:uncharacterized protein YlzI (FlbEa/FlbD family)